jgi:hypothetical protein
MKPKGSDYLKAAIIAYLIPWVAFFFQSAIVRSPVLMNGIDISLLLWMAVPAALNFVILLPFLRFQITSRFIAAILVVGWIGLSMF